jgi:hypothetical protein
MFSLKEPPWSIRFASGDELGQKDVFLLLLAHASDQRGSQILQVLLCCLKQSPFIGFMTGRMNDLTT